MSFREKQFRFYKSTNWQNIRDAIMSERGGLCERCYKNGIIKAASVVHHVKPVNEQNIDDPSITLNPDNLMCLCTDCHAAVHSKRRYFVKPDGTVAI